MEKGAVPQNPQNAISGYLKLHLFQPSEQYSASGRSGSSHKRTRTDPGEERARKLQKVDLPQDAEVIDLDEVSPTPSPLPIPFRTPPRSLDQATSERMSFGVTLEQAGRLLGKLLQIAGEQGVPYSIGHHLDGFLLPAMRYLRSSEPLHFLCASKQLSQSDFLVPQGSPVDNSGPKDAPSIESVPPV